MVSYQFSISFLSWGFILLFSKVLAIISRVSVARMFVYRFVMSNEARAKWGSMGVSASFLSRSLVFSKLYLLGRGASSLIFWVNNWASVYAGTPRQLTTGRIGCSGLCNLISPFMDRAVGFRFMYFHFVSEGISVLLLFITFLTWDWNDFVGLFFEVWKLFVCLFIDYQKTH